MANKNTKAMSNEEWLSREGVDGTVTFVNSGGSSDVAWTDTDPSSHLANTNSQGQTYAQGTIHSIGGSAFESSGYAVYDGAQNFIGYVAGDGTAFVTDQDENMDFVANTDIGRLSASSQQALKDASAKLESAGKLNGSNAQQAVAEINAARASGRGNGGWVEIEPGKRINLNAIGGGDGGGSSGRDYAGEMRELLDQWRESAGQQHSASVDHAVEQAIAELQRSESTASDYYERQQEQISADELAARDNSALYAQLRGDKGGIGRAQYDAIAAAAAKNRRTVASAQTKLATDTARRISELRAQGEFEKADGLLGIAQSYLQQLMSLQQWAAEFGLESDKFEESVRQWQAEFELKSAQYRQSLLSEQNRQLSSSLAESGNALLKSGIMPNSAQLAAMGMDEAQAQAYIMGNELKGGYSGGAVKKEESEKAEKDWVSLREQMYTAGIKDNIDAMDYLTQHLELSRLDAEAIVYGESWDDDYEEWMNRHG